MPRPPAHQRRRVAARRRVPAAVPRHPRPHRVRRPTTGGLPAGGATGPQLPPRPGLITPAEWPRSLTHAGLDSVDIRPDHRQTREISSSLFSAMAMDPPPILIFPGQAAILIALPYLLWRQTPLQRIAALVVVQILVGLGLGPSLLGQAVPTLASALLQGEGLAALSGLAWLAVVMFAFLTGLHFDTAEISGRRRGFFCHRSRIDLRAGAAGDRGRCVSLRSWARVGRCERRSVAVGRGDYRANGVLGFRASGGCDHCGDEANAPRDRRNMAPATAAMTRMRAIATQSVGCEEGALPPRRGPRCPSQR